MLDDETNLSHTIFAEAVVGQDGELHLDSLLTILQPGTRVSLTISSHHKPGDFNQNILRGCVVRYDNPYEPATDANDWEILR